MGNTGFLHILHLIIKHKASKCQLSKYGTQGKAGSSAVLSLLMQILLPYGIAVEIGVCAVMRTYSLPTTREHACLCRFHRAVAAVSIRASHHNG